MMIFRLTLAFLTLWLWLPTAHATDIQVRTDRNPVAINESFKLTFTADGKPDDEPDFSPLEQQFDIISQQHGSSTSWVNGKSSRTQQWVLRVMAKAEGNILIPPIAFGSDSSPPSAIQVVEQAQATGNRDEIFLRVEASPEQPWVQSQVLYTLKLFRRIQITQASLDEPDVKDAIVERLGEDSTYMTQVDGIDYWVTERKYAIFPQQAGIVSIAPLTLTAEVITDHQPRFNGFFSRQNTETRRVQSQALTLTVKPIPEVFKAPHWLSATSLQLTERWSTQVMEVKVGEPLTRTLSLSAKGASVGQLPELVGQTRIDGLKTYPDQPVLREDQQPDGLIARREEKLAYIASHPGHYTLPELAIPWFNTQTQRVEIASIPAVTITVLPAAAAPTSAPVVTEPTQIQTGLRDNADARLWQGVSALLAAGWMVTLIVGGWCKRRMVAAPAPQGVALPQPGFQAHALQQACQRNDGQAAKLALLAWGKQTYGTHSLSELAAHCDDPLSGHIETLNRALYAPEDGNEWNGDGLWLAFKAQPVLSRPRNLGEDDGLEPLFRL
ncbi:MAG: protein BatD [Methylomonas sp.]|nr:protein BatD [Methylomonas sp.]PPD22609.1 MAG: hypothetical protein CTY23_01635 [Methylomonas sp.]PPD27919.1 MAG: hypothetical protein CTY22_00515 [Methylomonas sp.]PPD40029.1 MAG: hypothetical protein CTY21_00515 [Methylomonas sp.]PPD41583.1 MAG: hypothetical protein CTY17_03635 [Methylomonas sp.]